MARIPGSNWQYGQGYAPAPFHVVVTVLAQLAIPCEQYVFVDLGCGKGRVLLLASGFPFRAIVGVEYSPRLSSIARENVLRYRHPDQRCQDLQVIEGDAADFDFPPQPLVVFFHHPFDEPVFRRVLARLERSLATHPRPVVVVYFDPRCGHLFDTSGLFQRRPLEDPAEWTVPVAVFDARCAVQSAAEGL
jgi:SAM-dependent methyltransferase